MKNSSSNDDKKPKELTDYNEILELLRKDFYKKFEDKTKSTSEGLEKFKRMQILGEGSFGRVILVRYSVDGKYYAMKMLDKAKIIKLRQIEHSLYEKKMLESIKFPFIMSMQFCFQDFGYLCFIMPFLNGGDMFIHLRRLKKFDENLAKFYGAQILLALEYMHFCQILYRDLKPENILVDIRGYLKIADLGFCKIVKGRTWTLCGTPEYIAPEIILSKGYGAAVDWWSYGVLLYEMNAGYSPFSAKDAMSIYEKIVIGKFKIPPHFSYHLLDIVKNLLQVDLTKRYGNLKNGVMDIKGHSWFHGITWLDIYYQKIEPSYKPHISGEADTSNFDNYGIDKPKALAEDKYKKEFEMF